MKLFRQFHGGRGGYYLYDDQKAGEQPPVGYVRVDLLYPYAYDVVSPLEIGESARMHDGAYIRRFE